MTFSSLELWVVRSLLFWFNFLTLLEEFFSLPTRIFLESKNKRTKTRLILPIEFLSLLSVGLAWKRL
jgi:hypothetical protein